MVLPNVSPEDAQKLFPQHRTENVPSGKPYIRITPQPQ
jgi:1-Cys peroxiredoxin 6